LGLTSGPKANGSWWVLPQNPRLMGFDLGPNIIFIVIKSIHIKNIIICIKHSIICIIINIINIKNTIIFNIVKIINIIIIKFEKKILLILKYKNKFHLKVKLKVVVVIVVVVVIISKLKKKKLLILSKTIHKYFLKKIKKYRTWTNKINIIISIIKCFRKILLL